MAKIAKPSISDHLRLTFEFGFDVVEWIMSKSVEFRFGVEYQSRWLLLKSCVLSIPSNFYQVCNGAEIQDLLR